MTDWSRLHRACGTAEDVASFGNAQCAEGDAIFSVEEAIVTRWGR